MTFGESFSIQLVFHDPYNDVTLAKHALSSFLAFCRSENVECFARSVRQYYRPGVNRHLFFFFRIPFLLQLSTPSHITFALYLYIAFNHTHIIRLKKLLINTFRATAEKTGYTRIQHVQY